MGHRHQLLVVSSTNSITSTGSTRDMIEGLSQLRKSEDAANVHEIIGHLPAATVMALATWALSSLRKLEAEKEWSADVVDVISYDAIEMGLADTDAEDGMFIVTV